jgi:hypothetical protein
MFDRLKTMPIHFLEVKITTQTALLSPYLRKKLNPLKIRLNSCKDIPFKTDPKYKPIFAQLKFVDDSAFSTDEFPQQPVCKFAKSHVFLIGEKDATQMKE